jgi:DNA-binding CsgD family transcriptional regulator
MDTAGLIDDIYEAAVVPERWDRVLDSMAAISDGEGTMLFAHTPGSVQWIASAAIRDMTARWVGSEWAGPRNGRGARLIPIREPRFLTDLDAFTLEEIEREPFYAEFLRPLGLGWCVGTAIHAPSGDALVFSVEKRHSKGPVERGAVAMLDGLRPHLARAALLAARVGLERARATVDTLDTMGYPAAVLAQDGRALAVNARFADCRPGIVLGARDAVSFASPAAGAIFAEALAAMRGGSSARTGRSVPIAAGETAGAMVAHVLPLRRAARDVFSGAYSLLFVTPVQLQRAPPLALLEGLFDLTATEAKVAALLVEGQSVEAVAAAQGVMANTVRMHLKSIFAKTGVHRQAELVSLLAMPSFGERA